MLFSELQATSYKVFYAQGGSVSTANTQATGGMISGTMAIITGLKVDGGTATMGPAAMLRRHVLRIQEEGKPTGSYLAAAS
jgi:hypothetical protein